MEGRTVLFRGAGDLVSGSIRRAHLVGFRVACTEIPEPLCVRRLVSFASAVYDGSITVEGVTAERVEADGIDGAWMRGVVPVIVDPDLGVLSARTFDALVDGTMAKRNLGTRIDHAACVIALGPGFVAGRDCHAVVETLAGHDLGRVILEGPAARDTGVPGHPGDCTVPAGGGRARWDDVVVRAPADGRFASLVSIGDVVDEGQDLGTVGGARVRARLGGVVRGLIHDGREVVRGLKIGDVDPGCEVARAFTIGSRSNAIAGGVLEALLAMPR